MTLRKVLYKSSTIDWDFLDSVIEFQVSADTIADQKSFWDEESEKE
jgi:hypothetical protein